MRGQAFDVFKLVIAAAVGMTLLVLLLSIMQGITPPGLDPVQETQKLLRETYFQGTKKVSASPVTFKVGDKFTTDSLVRGLDISATKIEIVCNMDGLVCVTNSVEASKAVKAKVVVDCLAVSSSTGCIITYESPV